MILLLVLLLRCESHAVGQFFNLATPADGSFVQFATGMGQKNTDQPGYGKLFRIDSEGLRVVEIRALEAPAPPPGSQTGLSTNAYDLISSDVSADGQLTAQTGRMGCVGNLVACSKRENFSTAIARNGTSHDYPGKLRLSPNGKWAFGVGSQSNPGFFPTGAYRLNLDSGELLKMAAWDLGTLLVSSTGCSVADDGTIVFSDSYGMLYMIRAGEEMPAYQGLSGIPKSNFVIAGRMLSDPVIDAAASTVVFAAADRLTGNSELRTTAPGSLDSQVLDPDGYAPSISNDGQLVIYLSRRTGVPQVLSIQVDGSNPQQISSEAEGISQAVLSGDGSTVYAVTHAGRMLKLRLDCGSVEEIIPRTPSLTGRLLNELDYGVWAPLFLNSYSGFAPGKQISIEGTGFCSDSAPADASLPESLCGAQIQIHGSAARMVSAEPTRVTLLIPPITFASEIAVQLRADSSSPFEMRQMKTMLQPFAPSFLDETPSAAYSGIRTVHEDGSTTVSLENPAHPNEIVRSFGVGFGPTIPAVPYGDPAPSAPSARLATPLNCLVAYTSLASGSRFSGPCSRDLRDVQGGLACPTVCGGWQIRARMPLGWNTIHNPGMDPGWAELIGYFALLNEVSNCSNFCWFAVTVLAGPVNLRKIFPPGFSMMAPSMR